MMNKFASLATSVVALFAVAACDANFYSIYRTVNLESGASPLTDAQTRLVVNVPNFKAMGQNQPARLICAEPSPDVAQAISFAIKAAANFDVPTQVSGGGSFAGSGASAIAQLGERLAVIQLLRDKMYRACEAYANGAVNDVSYMLILARMDKTMATMLSAEMAAGAFGRTLAQVGGTSSVGGASADELASAKAKLDEAIKQVKTDATPGSDGKVDAEKVKKALAALDTAAAELTALQLKAAQVSAASTAGNRAIGTIQTVNAGGAAAAIATMQQAYLDDDGLEPLTDACLHKLSSIQLDPNVLNNAPVVRETREAAAQARSQKNMVLAAQLEKKADNLNQQYERAVMEKGGPFAYLCATDIFKGEMARDDRFGYVALRLNYKLRLRKESVDIGLITLCGNMIAINAQTTDAAAKAAFAESIRTCNGILRRNAPPVGGGGGGAQSQARTLDFRY